MTHSIETERKAGGWTASFDDYDGAPDSPNRAEYGTGKTELDAIEDLIETVDGQDITICLSAIGMVGECDPFDYHEHIQSAKAERKREAVQAYAEDHGLSAAAAYRIGAL